MYISPEADRLSLSEVEKLSSVARSAIAGRNSVRRPGEYFVAAEPNAIALPAIDSCPGKTDYCAQDCYGIESEKRDATARALQRNFDILQGKTADEMHQELKHMLARYQTRADRLKIPEDRRRFRIHWDGDFFSVDYARAWRQAILDYPAIKFWVYTRSFQPDTNIVPVLHDVPNLDLFISVDRENLAAAKPVVTEYPGIRVAYLVDYQEEATGYTDRDGNTMPGLVDLLGRRQNFRQLACPENMRKPNGQRKLPVISKRGGACAVCTYCIDKPVNWDVVFVKTGWKHDPKGVPMSFIESMPQQIKSRQKRKVAQPAGALATNQASTQAALF